MRLIYLILIASSLCLSCDDDDDDSDTPIVPPESLVLPDVSEASFTNPTTITNMYYGPGPGEVYVYEGGEVGEEPEEEIRIEIRTTTKVVMGVTCAIQNDRVFEDGILIEDTDDWLAQDDDGNLWYFGELAENYENGVLVDTEGSWESGVDGALPGYWIPANPVVGDAYYQEFWEGEAEDWGEVVEVGATVTIGLGTYENCLVTKDVNPLENEIEFKYYAPGIGLIKEEGFEDGELEEVVELVEIL